MKQRAEFYKILGSQIQDRPFKIVTVDCLEHISKRLMKTINELQAKGMFVDRDYVIKTIP